MQSLYTASYLIQLTCSFTVNEINSYKAKINSNLKGNNTQYSHNKRIHQEGLFYLKNLNGFSSIW